MMQLVYVLMLMIVVVVQLFMGGYEIFLQDGGMGLNVLVLQILGGMMLNFVLNYNFIVSNFFGVQVWQLGWIVLMSVQVLLGMLVGVIVYMWKVVVQDGYFVVGNYQVMMVNYFWMMLTMLMIFLGSVVFLLLDLLIVVLTFLMLMVLMLMGVLGQILIYVLWVVLGCDGVFGQLVQFVQLVVLVGVVLWQVLNLIFYDGGVYMWIEVVGDQYGSFWVEFVNCFIVLMRVVNLGLVLVDLVGLVMVNLVNGNVVILFILLMVVMVGGVMGFLFNYNFEVVINVGLMVMYYIDLGVVVLFLWLVVVFQVSCVDLQINFNWNIIVLVLNLVMVMNGVVGVVVNFQIIWMGFIILFVGFYNFGFISDDGVQLYLNNSIMLIIDYWINLLWMIFIFGISLVQILVVIVGSGLILNIVMFGGVIVLLLLLIMVKYYQVIGLVYINFFVEFIGNVSVVQSVFLLWLIIIVMIFLIGWQLLVVIVGDVGLYVFVSNQGGYVIFIDVSGGIYMYIQMLINGVLNGGYILFVGEIGVFSFDVVGMFIFSDELGVVYLFNIVG